MPTLTPASEDTRIYEICVLYPSNLSQKEESDLLKEVETIFAEAHATQVSKDSWGKRGLAYSIKGNTEGCYMVYYYDMDPSKLTELDTALRILPNVLRHIIIKPPKGYEVVKYSEKYVEWKKEASQADERQKREREERIAQKVAEKAKRQVKRVADEKKKEDETPAPKADKQKISEQLDKLISDDDLNL